jgi:hypothetical protein
MRECPSEINATDLLLDIQDLIGRGYSDRDIAEKVEIPLEKVGDLIALLRQRREENL